MRTVLLQAASGNTGLISNLVLFGAIGLIMYFFMIRPQQKKAKDQKKFREEIKRGDAVVTIGGMHGRIASIEDDTITLEVGGGVKLTFEKSSVSMEASKKTVTAAPAKV